MGIVVLVVLAAFGIGLTLGRRRQVPVQPREVPRVAVGLVSTSPALHPTTTDEIDQLIADIPTSPRIPMPNRQWAREQGGTQPMWAIGDRRRLARGSTPPKTLDDLFAPPQREPEPTIIVEDELLARWASTADRRR